MVRTTLFKELANPARLHIITLLLEGERCVCEILPEIPLAQPTVSIHLRSLERAGLITARRSGKRIYYRIADARIKTVLRAAERMA